MPRIGDNWLVPSRVELAVASALRDAAEQVTGSPALSEKQFRSCLREKLSSRLEQSQTACEVDEQEFAVSLKEWPGVGRVDLLIRDPLGDPYICLELKCGRGTLYNCAWDLAKTGVIVARGLAHRAYLVAAAPETDWHIEQGRELFETGQRTGKSLIDDYRKYWEFWKTEVKTRPKAIPTAIETTLVSDELLAIGGEPWILRTVEVKASPEDWLDIESGITLSRWRTHFTWKVGDVDFLTEAEAQEILGDSATE